MLIQKGPGVNLSINILHVLAAYCYYYNIKMKSAKPLTNSHILEYIYIYLFWIIHYNKRNTPYKRFSKYLIYFRQLVQSQEYRLIQSHFERFPNLLLETRNWVRYLHEFLLTVFVNWEFWKKKKYCAIILINIQ